MIICKAVLATDWYPCTNLVKASKSHTIYEKKVRGDVCNGDYNPDVLEHLDREK
jgi:hypothetical protein